MNKANVSYQLFGEEKRHTVVKTAPEWPKIPCEREMLESRQVKHVAVIQLKHMRVTSSDTENSLTNVLLTVEYHTGYIVIAVQLKWQQYHKV